jgi:sugar lactone lactonase YvrE
VRRKAVAAVAALVSLALAAAAMGQSTRARIDLPRGWQPEGVAAGRGTQLFVGSIPTGAVVRIDARNGRSRVVVAGRRGRAATGLKVAGGSLFVAGAGTGRAWVYDARTGRERAEYRLAGNSTDTFVNDVAVTARSAFFTDSRRMVLYIVPRSLKTARVVQLSGIRLEAGNNLNGIVAPEGGRTLIAVQTNTGKLWRINPTTGSSREIDLGGDTVMNGDGLLLTGHRLYVVQNSDNRIAVVDLAADYTTGRVVRSIGSAGFDVPTTVARIGDDLFAVNARFGEPATAATRYWITRVPR